MELKEIKVDSILANFYQPRTKFDREKIKELSESILSNGLINPITVTPDKKRQGKYMIVSGERRWQAHKIAGLKTIQTVVKTYSTDGQFMVESLIENLHREDLISKEKVKFCDKIMKEEKIPNVTQLAKRISKAQNTVQSWFTAEKYSKKYRGPISPSVVDETRGLLKEQKEFLLKQAAQEDFGSREMRKRVSEIKVEDKPEPIQLERTANDVVDDILTDLHSFKYNVDELLKSNVKDKINIEDLSKSKANRAMTTSILHLKILVKFVNVLRKRGAIPDKIILALIKSNGKI